MSASLHYFIVRPDGTKTPLIAVDELPSNFHILGVPPFISDAQTHGMVSLGLVPSSGRCYVVQQDEKSPTSSASFGASTQLDSDKLSLCPPMKYTAHDVGFPRIESLSLPQTVSSHSRERCSLPYSYHRDGSRGAKWYHSEPHVDNTQAVIDAVTRASSEMAPQTHQQALEHPAADSTQPARRKKIYCNYWLRKGECDYMQQGCLYRHEMPLDKATLASLGLREVPRWYTEQWASVAASARTQRDDHVNRPWRATKSTPPLSTIQPDAPGALLPASTNTEPTHIRQRHVLPSTLPPSAPIRPQKEFEMNEQRPSSDSNKTISPTTQSCNGSRRSKQGILKHINEAQPARQGSTAPDVPTTPTRARGHYMTAQHRPTSPYRHQRDHFVSVIDPPAAVPAMTPSQAPLKRCSQGTSCLVLPNATFYPGVLRTASPAHPRLFVKDGQGKYAVNQSVESEEHKTTVSRTLNQHGVTKKISKSSNAFGDLGI